MPEEKKTETPKTQTTPTTDTSPLTPTGATQSQQFQQDPTTLRQDPLTAEQEHPLTDLELKEMNTLTALDEPTEEQKKRLSELQQRLPKNPAKLRNKQRT
jgi:hypothetical protein